MEVVFYQSECGDAARISFNGNDNEIHNIFIDSGYERTFRDIIRNDITDLTEKNEKIDYWIISHIHDDHIGGVKKYIDYINNGELKDLVSNWIYNAPRFYAHYKYDTSSISKAESIGQGDILYNFLKSIDKMPSLDFTNNTKPIDIAGMKITFLSPTIDKLQKLREKYNITQLNSFELIEDDTISGAVGFVENDYQTKILDFDLDNWKEDDNIENGSSISFITEINEKKILWLADSHPSDVVKSLINLGYSTVNKFNCEFVKVTHHGSKGNNSNTLYDLIDCENYIFSTNGENKYKLPSKESLARILRNGNRNFEKKYNVHFLYDNDTLRNIFDNEDSIIYKNLNFEVFFSSNKLNIFNISIG